MLENGWTWPGNRETEGMAEAEFPLYYNNFEVVKLEQFRRPDVRLWLDEIMKDPLRIFKYRWGKRLSSSRIIHLIHSSTGDAPLRYATVSMFFNLEHEVELFCDVKYYHQWLQDPQCKCVPLE